MYQSIEEIAAAMETSVEELQFLAFGSDNSNVSHYVYFQKAKSNQGQRIISAPLANLKRLQRWVAQSILHSAKIHDAAHGFCHKRSILTNAKLHVGAKVIINLDLQDFFSKISYHRVKKIFTSLGYSEIASEIFTLLCTTYKVKNIKTNHKSYFVSTKKRCLPQGSPASPVISNIICYDLDRALTQAAEKYGFRYTRYVDDLTFSTSSNINKQNIFKFIREVKSISGKEGFILNSQKKRIAYNFEQQKITGLIVNEKINIPRITWKRFRATVYQIEKDGLDGKFWGSSTDIIASITGFAAFLEMVNPEKAVGYKLRIKRIQEKYRDLCRD